MLASIVSLYASVAAQDLSVPERDTIELARCRHHGWTMVNPPRVWFRRRRGGAKAIASIDLSEVGLPVGLAGGPRHGANAAPPIAADDGKRGTPTHRLRQSFAGSSTNARPHQATGAVHAIVSGTLLLRLGIREIARETRGGPLTLGGA